ncbi:hypothetical protein BU25DRAFT_407767 [Macroventuria anomochaeta]|uniref:Uncharacterized protein n=1 Tax=Macroventuria anomochaeta TaxID=301207 RepID=A0ACB6SD50_9PLEO|nr:uncharacterized protein BU25DRAFT_407767 [Macroventuria anomochaeta]KAF2631244.1 hypothetical protein BU25DRAFT_407767 [Macroventuria anomochaeta]
MPSFFKKLIYGKKLSNPYVNPYHPGHTSIGSPNSSSTSPYPTYPQPPEDFSDHSMHPTSLTLSTRLQPRSAIPLGSRDYLGEARLLAGRDPVTGRPVPPQQFDSYAARSGQSISPTGHGNPQPPNAQLVGIPDGRQQPLQSYQAASGASFNPYPEAGDPTQWEPKSWHPGEVNGNPYVTGGDAAMGRPIPQTETGRVNHAGTFVKKAGRKTNLEGRVYATDKQRVGTRYDIVVREERRKKENEQAAAAAAARAASGYFAPHRTGCEGVHSGA